MLAMTNADGGSRWLFEVSGRLLILGWFTLASVAFGLLCGVVVVKSAARHRKILTTRFAA